MRILFWNTNKKRDINAYLSSIIADYMIDIAVLAEYEANEQEFYNLIRLNQQMMLKYPSIGCERIRMYGNYTCVEPASQNEYYSIQIIDHKFILCGVHLPSDLHEDMSQERCMLAREIMYDVHNEEKSIGRTSTIIVGDINDMPYSGSCLNADTFHALPVFEREAKQNRSVLGTQYQKYYNPMWSFFGDLTYPPGTYYKSASSLHAPMWYMLDQFILGYDIIPLLKREQLRIITDCSHGKLSNSRGHPQKLISDHFPIMCEIND